MDLGVLGGVALVDWLLIIYFLGFFVLGFAQGTIRRLIGIASILFSFLFAANIADPLSDFLAAKFKGAIEMDPQAAQTATSRVSAPRNASPQQAPAKPVMQSQPSKPEQPAVAKTGAAS